MLPLQKNYRVALPVIRAFSRHLDAFRPDILHVNSLCKLGYTAIQYARRAGISMAASPHTLRNVP